jgi:thiamine pyrophosphokinase
MIRFRQREGKVEAVVVANAPFRFWPEAYQWVRQAPLLVAADGGANHLARVGVRPHFVVGDLDSLDPQVRRWVGEERIVPRPDQDHTDLEKTLAFVQEQGASRALVLAATGGRLDHALENLAILARLLPSLPCEIREQHTRIVPVSGEASFPVPPGATVSLMPLGSCFRVWTEGLFWPLEGEPLSLTQRTGLSNRATSQVVRVRVEGGVLLVFLPC